MVSEDRDRIFSEEYADLLIDYSGELSVFEEFQDATVQIISYLYAAVHVPVEQITENIIVERGYSVMPKCFGLISEASLEATGIQRIRNIPRFNLRGQGVLMGIIDTGIDYTNSIFQYADGTTRIASIWDQTIISDNNPDIAEYGTEYARELINEALLNDNPFDIVPSMDYNGHGTMVAGIAGGNEMPENNFFGVAPDVEFVVVKLKPAKQYLRRFFLIPDDAECYSEIDILFALYYLLNASILLQQPMVICLALGTSQGGHDGRGILSNTFGLTSNRQGIVSVVAAGNEGNGRRHYSGLINTVTGYDTVEVNVGEREEGFSMELWGQTPSIFSIDILSPSGEYVPRIAAGMDQNRVITFIFEQTTIYLDYQMVESQTGDQLILLRFINPAPGIWRINVYERGDLNLAYNVWLPMEKFITENTFFIRSSPNTTILSLGNTQDPITVTAYNHMDQSLYLNASRGYTRVGVIKPEIAAPGVNVIGPTLDQGFTEFTGTSVAAAHAAGVAAMILEWGYVRESLPRMSTVEVKKLLIRGARRDINIEYPNRDWGYGIMDIFNVFDSLRTGIVI